jgi:hypothetical protein
MARLDKSTIILIAVLLVVLVILFFVMRKRKEKFSFGNIFKKIGNFGKNVGKTVAGVAVGAAQSVGIAKPPGYVPEYTSRINFDGVGFFCPDSTVDIGEGKCLVGDYTPFIWKKNKDGSLRWRCPQGTAYEPGNEWNKNCRKGYTQRIPTKTKGWICGAGGDTGVDPNNTDPINGQKQCQLGWAPNFTHRIEIDGKVQCPAGWYDTGVQWGTGINEFRQCAAIFDFHPEDNL